MDNEKLKTQYKTQYINIDDAYIFKAQKQKQSFLLVNKIYNLLKKEINHRMKFMKGIDSDDE